MTKNILALPQLKDKRKTLPRHPRAVRKRTTRIRDLERGIHHSATRANLAGSNPEGFARHHTDRNGLNWPTIGYTFVITPSRIIDTPNGPRAEISLCLNLDEMGYHVGNSNNYSMGICIAGDYRYDRISDAVAASFVELNDALDKDKVALGRMRGHNEYPGWKSTACPVFSYEWVLNRGRQLIKNASPAPKPTPEPEPSEVQDRPDFISIQEGDNLWQISRRFEMDYDELIMLNNHLEPTNIPVGTLIRMNEEAIREEDYAGSWQSEDGVPYRQEHGVFENTSGVTIAVRKDGPKLSIPVFTRLQHGDTFTYDRVYQFDNHVWVSKVHDGERRYMPIRTYQDDKMGEAWGNITLLK